MQVFLENTVSLSIRAAATGPPEAVAAVGSLLAALHCNITSESRMDGAPLNEDPRGCFTGLSQGLAKRTEAAVQGFRALSSMENVSLRQLRKICFGSCVSVSLHQIPFPSDSGQLVVSNALG